MPRFKETDQDEKTLKFHSLDQNINENSLLFKTTEKHFKHSNQEMQQDEETLEPYHYYDSETVPFKPEWIYGIDTKTGVINLTKNKSHCRIFYTAAHLGVVYDHKEHQMQFLLGHKNYINSITADGSGRWLVMVDLDQDNALIIWDSEECFPVLTIFNAHENGILTVGLSQDAKYLITVGNDPDPIIKFWLWTFGNEKENDSFQAKSLYGPIQNIAFNQNYTSHFLVTFAHTIVFLSWDQDKNKLDSFIPTVASKKQKSIGTYVQSTYMTQTHKCVTATVNGWLIVWGNRFYTVPFESVSNDNNKIFLKAVKVQNSSITCINFVDGVIVTCDEDGNIKFYDQSLKILYWCQNFKLSCIRAISFNTTERLYEIADPFDFYSEPTTAKTEEKKSKTEDEDDVEDKSEEYEKIFAQLLPSDYTLQRAPFIVRDFVILTDNGLLGYVDFVENKCIPLIKNVESPVTSIGISNNAPSILCLGHANGQLYTYNYETNKPVLNYTIISSKKDLEKNAITCIQYSPGDLFMACGTMGGFVWFLNPTILKPNSKKPFIYDSSSIYGILFAPNNKYVAYYDSGMGVSILKYKKLNDSPYIDWEFHGRYIAHSKTITDILFVDRCRLFSIAKDRYMVEYDVEKSEPGKLDLRARGMILQSSEPTCFLTYEIRLLFNIETVFFLVASNNYKYYVVNDQNFVCERTFLAPIIDIPVQHLLVNNNNPKYMLFSTKKYLGIQLLPLSGNPFKIVSMVVHPSKIFYFLQSQDGKSVFTFGKNDNTVIKWKIEPESVDILADRGGTELTPYYCLMEGGVNGWLFHEMRDLFYYMQILHQGEDSPFARDTSHKLPTNELPNLMRSIGFYPTAYELDNLLYEVKFYYAESKVLSQNKEEEITFENFVKLFLNHRPATKYCYQDIKNSFNYFATRNKISRRNFIEIMCNKGEEFSQESLQHCLTILTNLDGNNLDPEDDSDKLSTLLPDIITYEYLTSEILGIEPEFEPSNEREQN